MRPTHGGQLAAIARQFGVEASGLIDFSANINPDGPPAGVVEALRSALDDPATLGLYPDLEERRLKESIAAYAGVEASRTVVANGFVPLLDAALRTLPIRRCLVPVPAFTEYRRTLERAGVAITTHELVAADDFPYEVSAFVTGDHDAILLTNPQNPSGVSTGYAEMTEIVAAAAARKLAVLLDEAFIDYAAQQSLSSDVGRFRNLIVFRSVTKFHAMPGLRVAYAVAHAELVARLNVNLSPWPITTLAARGVCTALADQAYITRTLNQNAGRRAKLVAGLRVLGLNPHPSSANFLLFKLPDNVHVARFWQRLIVHHGIVVRDCSNYEALPAGYLRVAVRSDTENEFLLRGLGEVLKK